MEKSEFRVLIKHYFLRGKSIKETEEKLYTYSFERSLNDDKISFSNKKLIIMFIFRAL